VLTTAVHLLFDAHQLIEPAGRQKVPLLTAHAKGNHSLRLMVARLRRADKLITECAVMLTVKRSCSNWHNQSGQEARPAECGEGDGMHYVPTESRLGKIHVDEVMCRMPGASKKAAIVRFHPLSMRMGMAGARKLRADATMRGLARSEANK
jgi:hypothetical protein